MYKPIMKKKIMITGSNGMLGTELVKTLTSDYSLIGVNRKPDSSSGLDKFYVIDINDHDRFSIVLNEENPDIIIHTAAIVDIDYCEVKKIECYDTNYDSTVNIISAISEETLFVFISTESVFNNSNVIPKEDDKKNPPNYYCELKSMAEDYITANHKNSLIIRTNMYGFHSDWRGSLVEWAIDKLSEGNQFNGFYDVLFNPLYTWQIADIIKEIIALKYTGVIHLGSDLILSKFDFVKRIAEGLGFERKLVFPVSLDEGKWATRNKIACLNISRLQSLVGPNKVSFEIGFNKLLEDLVYANERNHYW
jgi:dTDP-4-dehydrorhamnose reductase